MNEKGTCENSSNCVDASIRTNHNTTILDIKGALNHSCSSLLAEGFARGIAAAGNILLNLSALEYMDVEGAGLLAMNAVRAAREKIPVSACCLPDPYRDVFHLTGLDEAIVLYDSEEDALHGRNLQKKYTGYSDSGTSQSAAGWARFGGSISITNMPPEIMNINVDGRMITFPANGFGRLWDKKYRLRLSDPKLNPQDIVAVWRSEFPDFWPQGNRLFPSAGAPIAPGTAAVLNLSLPGGLVLATGIMVIHADETSFSFSTVQGHILAGWITFSSFREEGAVIIQVHPLFRPGDPLMELGFRLGAAKQEDRFWHETLGNLSRRLGTSGEIEQQDVLVDSRVQWLNWKNIQYSAAVRSSLYMPLHLLKKGLRFLKNNGTVS